MLLTFYVLTELTRVLRQISGNGHRQPMSSCLKHDTSVEAPAIKIYALWLLRADNGISGGDPAFD